MLYVLCSFVPLVVAVVFSIMAVEDFRIGDYYELCIDAVAVSVSLMLSYLGTKYFSDRSGSA